MLSWRQSFWTHRAFAIYCIKNNSQDSNFDPHTPFCTCTVPFRSQMDVKSSQRLIICFLAHLNNLSCVSNDVISSASAYVRLTRLKMIKLFTFVKGVHVFFSCCCCCFSRNCSSSLNPHNRPSCVTLCSPGVTFTQLAPAAGRRAQRKKKNTTGGVDERLHAAGSHAASLG